MTSVAEAPSRTSARAFTVEREGEVVHVLAGRFADLSPLLGDLRARSRDFH